MRLFKGETDRASAGSATGTELYKAAVDVNGTRFNQESAGRCLKGNLPISCILLHTHQHFVDSVRKSRTTCGLLVCLLLDTLHGAFACAQAKRRRSSVGCSGGDTFGSLEL